MNGVCQLDYNTFLQIHKNQLLSCGIPEYFWHRLHEKLHNEIYDASSYFVMQKIEYSDDESDSEVPQFSWDLVVTSEKLLSTDSNNVFIVDHAWTFESQSAKHILLQLPCLMKRMAALMDIELEGMQPSEAVVLICEKMWRFCRYYKLSSSENAAMISKMPELQQLMWYVLDEVGSRIQHSDQPSARMVPFFYAPREMCCSIFWPVIDLNAGDSLTIDYVEHIKDPQLRPYYLLPWQPENYSDHCKEHTYVLSEEFFSSHRVQETLPLLEINAISSTTHEFFTVYTDMELVKTYLKDPRFHLVESSDQADIHWVQFHFKDFKRLSCESPQSFINQFPGEQVLTVKDLLASLASLSIEKSNNLKLDEKLTTDWYPVTFNLVYELPQFVAYYQSLENELSSISTSVANELTSDETEEPVKSATGIQQNVWILKPWNLGRGLGITISNNLDQIIRMCDVNPMIASRYITDPVLFYRADLKANVKFDIRYIVLLKSVQPLVLYTYKVFWLRFANKPFSLSDFDNYSKHFTVMNYRDDQNLKQIHCDEFVELFNQQYPNHQWNGIQYKIFNVLSNIFKAATKHPFPRGLSHCPQSRAMYAVDLLLEWRFKEKCDSVFSGSEPQIFPVVCEVNFTPDCTRACQYHPTFFNDVFSCLFLDQSDEINNHFVCISETVGL